MSDPLWYEVDKSKRAPKRARKAVERGADLVVVWGGDGMVQRTIDALAGTRTAIAIVPAGTANLLATNLGIPRDIAEAVGIALHGDRRALDAGVVNGEHFAVMAGAGFDAYMIEDADRHLKDRVGRAAYVYTGSKHLREPRVRARIKVDGQKWFKGDVSGVLVGNVGAIFGGITVFDDARPDDGRLDLGVITAHGVWQWARALTRTAVGHAGKSPLVSTTSATKISVRFDRPMPYELDGGSRGSTDRLDIRVEPGAAIVCVPSAR